MQSKPYTFNRRIFSILGSLLLVGSAQTGNLQLEVTDIRNLNGHILISIFDNARAYEGTSAGAGQYHTLLALKPRNGSIKVMLPDFPAGTYAVFVFHDENENSDLDTGLFGIPTEGFSFSNFHAKHDTPSFREIAFSHQKNTNQLQRFSLMYPN